MIGVFFMVAVISSGVTLLIQKLIDTKRIQRKIDEQSAGILTEKDLLIAKLRKSVHESQIENQRLKNIHRGIISANSAFHKNVMTLMHDEGEEL
jgi:low affinity Fe/Cu permease